MSELFAALTARRRANAVALPYAGPGDDDDEDDETPIGDPDDDEDDDDDWDDDDDDEEPLQATPRPPRELQENRGVDRRPLGAIASTHCRSPASSITGPLANAATPRPPRGPGDADDDELPMGDPPDEDPTDDPDDEDEGEGDDEPLQGGPGGLPRR